MVSQYIRAQYLRSKKLPEKALLLIDNASAHNPTQELRNGQITVMFLPSNCTALVQPLDQNVIQNVKIRYRKILLQEVLVNEDNDIVKYLKAFSLKDAVFSLAESWNQVIEQLIERSWCSLLATNFNEMNRNDEWNEEDMMPLSDLEQLVNQINRADDPIEKAEVEKWASGDEEMNLEMKFLEDEEIIASVTQKNQNLDDEEDEEVQSSPKISNKEAPNALTLSCRWAEENGLPLHEVILLKRIRQQAVNFYLRTSTQSKLDTYSTV